MLPWRTYLTAVPLMLCAHTAFAQGQDGNAPKPGQALQPAAAPAPIASAAPAAPVAATDGTELTWLGHAAWLLRSPAGTTVLIDPWLQNPRKPEGFVMPEHVDAILITHGHPDHVGEAVALAERYHVPVIAAFELIEQLGLKDGIGGNIGGTIEVQDLKIHLTQALHSSGVVTGGALPPPPADEAPCECPPEHACAEHGASHDAGKAEAGKADAAQPKLQAVSDSAAHKGHGHHPHELVVGDKDNDSTMGPAEKAVALGVALADKEAKGSGGHHGHKHGDHKHGGHKHGAKHEHDGAHTMQSTADASDKAAPAGADAETCHCDHHNNAAASVAKTGKPQLGYAGSAMGFVIEVERGPTIYHAGDTDLFLDMGLIKRRYAPEVALLPIGGHYTMGPKDAALAVGMLGVKDVAPMHYGTSPQLTGTVAELRTALGVEGRVIAPRPGAKITYATRR